MRLYPNVATAPCATTITRKVSQKGRFRLGNSAWMAKAPLTLLTMNQPKAPVKAFSPAGRTLPRKPNAPRLSTIIGTPNLGPQDETTAWVTEPRSVPTMMAVAASHRLRPKRVIARAPTEKVADSRLGESPTPNTYIAFTCAAFRTRKSPQT